MILVTPQRRYNLANWTMLAAGGRGSITVHLGDNSVNVRFSETSSSNPIDPDVLLSVVEKFQKHSFTLDELETHYGEELEVTPSSARSFLSH